MLLNFLANKMSYKSYLEIGLHSGFNFRQINCEKKIGVDPVPTPRPLNEQLVMSSNDYFASHTETFDLIFVDGLHESEQAYQDIRSAVARLNPRGTILVHDCNPLTEETQLIPRPDSTIGRAWHGDVWKSWVKFRREYPKMESYVVNLGTVVDSGCGIIEHGDLTHYDSPAAELEWEDLSANRKSLLNTLSLQEFLTRTRKRYATAC